MKTIEQVREWHKTKSVLRSENPTTQIMARLTLALLTEHEAGRDLYEDWMHARDHVERLLEEM